METRLETLQSGARVRATGDESAPGPDDMALASRIEEIRHRIQVL